MGFRNNAYATVWSVEDGKFPNTRKVRLSINRKNSKTNSYEQDFGAFCTFIGKACDAAQNLVEKDRIKLLSCDVSNTYSKGNNTTYTDYKVFEFEMADGSAAPTEPTKKTAAKKTAPIAEEGEVEEDELPF